jgi:hypothetical protein
VIPEIAARLAACDILMAAQAPDYCMFVRGNCVALAQTAAERITSLGSSGVMTEQGLAYLVWRDGAPWLCSHGNEVAAGAEQVDAIRKFSEDLKMALGLKKENLATNEHA